MPGTTSHPDLAPTGRVPFEENVHFLRSRTVEYVHVRNTKFICICLPERCVKTLPSPDVKGSPAADTPGAAWGKGRMHLEWQTLRPSRPRAQKRAIHDAYAKNAA